MKPICLPVLLLCLVTVLMGCSRTTTVILPPETAAPVSAAPESSDPAETAAPTTVAATDRPTQAPTTESSEEAPTEAPTTEPTESPTTESTEIPPTPTEPTTQPPTEPTPESEPARHPVYDISGHSTGALEYSLLDGINSQRADAGLDPLSLDHTLCALAAIRAYECSESFSLTRPDGRSGYSVVTDYGYAVWSDFSQRIHYGSAGLSAGAIVKGWMYTDDFSANILSGGFTHIGIGVYTTGGITYIVCFFAG